VSAEPRAVDHVEVLLLPAGARVEVRYDREPTPAVYAYLRDYLAMKLERMEAGDAPGELADDPEPRGVIAVLSREGVVMLLMAEQTLGDLDAARELSAMIRAGCTVRRITEDQQRAAVELFEPWPAALN
jgi:hypothetical protein